MFFLKNNNTNTLNVPLSNTIFMFHPIILIIVWCNLIYIFFLFAAKTTNIIMFCLLFLSLTLGGYWSIQEFNWGGWWNWDVLELFSLITIINYIIFFHFFKKNNNVFLHKIILLLINIMVVYYIFNKLGITSSIHSFIKSSFFKNNIIFNYLLGLTYLLLLKKNPVYFFKIIIIIIFFLYYQSLFIFKFFLLYLLFLYMFFKRKIFKKINSNVHIFILIICFIIMCINLHNTSFMFFYKINYCLNNNFISLKLISFKNYLPNITNTNVYTNFFFFKAININFFNLWFFCLKNLSSNFFNNFIFLKFF